MTYSVDSAYLEYYKCALKGKYKKADSFFKERGTAFSIGLIACLIAILFLFSRLLSLPFKILAVVFSLVSLTGFANHTKLLALSLIILIYQPFQLIVHFLSAVVGLIHPFIAYQLMQEASIPLVFLLTLEKKLKENRKITLSYVKIQKFFKAKLTRNFDKSPWPIQIAMKTMINEFSESMNAGIVAPLGWMDKFHLFDANPVVLRAEQKDLVPILLLNGNYSHQATFLPLLYALESSGNKRAVYTVNLPPNYKDTRLIIEKVEEIKKQFGKEKDDAFKIDAIGHSMGSRCIQDVLMADISFEINRLITVGTPFKNKTSVNKVFDITAKNDVIIMERSRLASAKDSIEIDTGHLGLLFHRESLNAMLTFLKS